MNTGIAAEIEGGTRGGLAVWLPWLLAPAFLLLPIGGCGVAAAIRRPAPLVERSRRVEPRPSADAVATVETVVTTVR